MADIIKSLKIKDSSGSYSTALPIGSDAKYITGSRKSGCRNLEEELLFGGNCITTEDNLNEITGIKVTVKEFRKENQTTDYYQLTIEERPSVVENIPEIFTVYATETLEYIDSSANKTTISIKQTSAKKVGTKITIKEEIQ